MVADPHLGKTYGNVRLTARLGQGAMGAVYRGWHERMDRDVAVKVLLNSHAKDKARERFLREGQSAAKIDHENVVHVLDAGVAPDGTAYLIMELVNGHSLGNILDENGALAPEVVARLGSSIALGLAAIHAKGIIHRDIKPDNILLGHDKKAKITDLGLAKQTDDPELNRLTATGMVVGTPLYVAPECIRDPRTATISADIYSLGATLYHLLTGRPPFTAESPYEVMRAHLEIRPQPLREIAPHIPSGMAQLVERCLAKAPERRPTALAVADALSQGSRLKASANRGLALLIGILTVAVLGAASVAWAVLTRPPPPAAALPPATLAIEADHPGARWRSDDGAWQLVAPGNTPTPAGRHHITVESTGGGMLRAWEGDVDCPSGARAVAAAALTTIPVTELRIPVPGDGMIFLDGVAFGIEPAVPLDHAGTYAIGRWDGSAWQSFTAGIDRQGRLSRGAAVVGAHPDGPAWWRERDDSGSPVDRHHVLCWWEIELARTRSNLSAPPGWLIQGQRREQPALGLNAGLLGAARDLFTAEMVALPGREVAARLSMAYQTGIWCMDQRRLDFLGSPSPQNALCALVPAVATGEARPHR